MSSLASNKKPLQSGFSRIRQIQKEDGLLELLKHCTLFLISPVYKRHMFYLRVRSVKADESMVDSHMKIEVRDLLSAMVSSNEEADKLEKEGYSFRSYPTDWNIGLTTYSRWLDEGMIAFCTFLNKDLAAINWVIPSLKTQKKVSLPLKVDYSNGEAFARGTWVNPKYRGLGLMRYLFYNRDRCLLSLGIKYLRTADDYNNKNASGAANTLGYTTYGQARLMRVLRWKFWKETYNN
jgi:hypothetical protein